MIAQHLSPPDGCERSPKKAQVRVPEQISSHGAPSYQVTRLNILIRKSWDDVPGGHIIRKKNNKDENANAKWEEHCGTGPAAAFGQAGPLEAGDDEQRHAALTSHAASTGRVAARGTRRAQRRAGIVTKTPN